MPIEFYVSLSETDDCASNHASDSSGPQSEDEGNIAKHMTDQHCTTDDKEKTRGKDPQHGQQARRHHDEDKDDEDMLKRLQTLGLEGGTGSSGLLTELRSRSPSRSPLARRTPKKNRTSRSPSRSPLARRDGRRVRCVYADEIAGCSRMTSVYCVRCGNQATPDRAEKCSKCGITLPIWTDELTEDYTAADI